MVSCRFLVLTVLAMFFELCSIFTCRDSFNTIKTSKNIVGSFLVLKFSIDYFVIAAIEEPENYVPEMIVNYKATEESFFVNPRAPPSVTTLVIA